MFRVKLLLFLLLLSATVFAADGVLEINQACALNGGCFAGDTAGFPVTIDGSAGRSYRLTSDLDLGAVPDTTAIDIDAPFITLDLNGFEIAGPITCTGSGAGLDCGALGNGDGITLHADADYVLIKNGTIRNMSRHGIGALGDRLTVRDVRARNNARDGLNGGLDSIAVNCIANENGNDGFQFGSGSVIEQSAAYGNGEDGIRIESSNGVIDNSTARNNGLQGFEMGHSSRFGKNASTGNGAVDTCGGGICTERRRFYLTPDTHDGNEALQACASGFHMASLPELDLAGDLVYDPILGLEFDDQGSGPPTGVQAWMRGGRNTSSEINCENWTTDSDTSGEGGQVVEWVDPITSNNSPVYTSPWFVSFFLCSASVNVWCVED